jgi:ligand-binding SRPBCC domain-containing protein
LAIHGPFSRFLHVHQFEDRDGHTLIRDLLEVSWPWRYGGSAVLKKVVAPRINRMFRLRSEALERLVEDGTLSSRVDRRLSAGGG